MNILDHLRELDIGLVTTDERFRQAMDIRRCVYCDDISLLTPETLIDEWDSRAEHFLASTTGRRIATGRMISAQSSVFEIEKYIDLDDYRALGRCAEVSRLCVLGEVRFPLVIIGMFRAFFRRAVVNDIRFVCITAARHHRRMYLDIGFKHIGGPFRNELLSNAFYDAYILDLVEVPELWTRRRRRMWEVFLQPIESIG